MSKEITYNEALSKLANLCSRSEQCIMSCKEKLAKWGTEKNDAEKVIQYLLKEKYIDEKRYARYFTKDKHQLSHWGRTKIAHALQAKQIPQNYIESALEEIDEENYSDQLQSLLNNKIKSIKYKSLYDLKGKLYRFALSRGFESSLALKAIDTAIKNNNIKNRDDESFDI